MAIDTEFVTQDEFKDHCEAIDKTLEEHGKKLDKQGEKIDALAVKFTAWDAKVSTFINFGWAILAILITLLLTVFGFLLSINNTLTNHILGK